MTKFNITDQFNWINIESYKQPAYHPPPKKATMYAKWSYFEPPQKKLQDFKFQTKKAKSSTTRNKKNGGTLKLPSLTKGNGLIYATQYIYN